MTVCAEKVPSSILYFNDTFIYMYYKPHEI